MKYLYQYSRAYDSSEGGSTVQSLSGVSFDSNATVINGPTRVIKNDNTNVSVSWSSWVRLSGLGILVLYYL